MFPGSGLPHGGVILHRGLLGALLCAALQTVRRTSLVHRTTGTDCLDLVRSQFYGSLTEKLIVLEKDEVTSKWQIGISYWLLIFLVGVVSWNESRGEDARPDSLRAKVTVENWDKGGPLSRWVYTHMSEVFPSSVIRRGGTIRELSQELRPEIGALKVSRQDQPEQTLDQFVNNGAVDGCIVLHAGKIVYEKYPTIQPDDRHLIFSVTKAFVTTALAILEGEGKIDLKKPVESYLPELKGSAWAGIRLRDVADMRSGIEGNESSADAYRNPAHKQFQLEATLGWQPRTAPDLPESVKRGDLLAFLGTLKREHDPGENWGYTSSNTAVLGQVIARVTGKTLADNISELIWSRIGAERDAVLLENERKFPVAHAGMACTLHDLARFGLLFTKSAGSAQRDVVSGQIIDRIFTSRGTAPDEHGMLPLTYQWDMVGDNGEIAKGGWAGQLLYINREKDVVVAYFGTNLTADPKIEPLPCRLIAKSF
jgi:CubicO group peptidase (beta-lactamase class C family)